MATTSEIIDIKKEYKLARKYAIWYLLGKKRTYKSVGEKFGLKSHEVTKYLTYYLPNASKFLNKYVRRKAERNSSFKKKL